MLIPRARTLLLATLLILAGGCGGTDATVPVEALVHAHQVPAEPPANVDDPARFHAADRVDPGVPHGAAARHESGPCSCRMNRAWNGWCATCAIGHVGGATVTHATLFEFIDPHGHDIRPETMACEKCRAAVEVDGTCATCGYGYLDGRLYASVFTHAIARGRVADLERVTCGACRRAAGRPAWCDAGGVGLVGYRAFTDRPAWETARDARARMEAASERALTCIGCAMAELGGTACIEHAASWGPPDDRTREADPPVTRRDGGGHQPWRGEGTSVLGRLCARARPRSRSRSRPRIWKVGTRCS